MSNCLVIDTETIGNEPNLEVQEVGAVLYSIEKQQLLACASCIYPTSAQENQPLSKIKPIASSSLPSQQSFEHFLKDCLKQSHYIVAHGKDFDRKALSLFQREPFDALATHPDWLCTYGDFQLFPDKYPGKRDLLSLALYYGVGISSAHRAIYDCLLITEVFNRVDDLEAAFTIASLPVIEAICPKHDSAPEELGFVWNYAKQGWFRKFSNPAEFPFPAIPEGERKLVKACVPYENRHLPKSWGFRWNEPIEKTWTRLINPEAARWLNFPVEKVFLDKEDEQC